MRRFGLTVIAVLAAVTGLPTAYYYFMKPDTGDQLDNTLRAMGFFPINPPNNLISLGSLYYVDSSARFFRTICPVDLNDLRNSITQSPSTRTVADALYSGSFKVGNDLAGATTTTGSGFNNNYLSRVKYSLSDVQLYEVDLSTNMMIMHRLMEKQSCRDAVDEVFRAGGYVCQGQTLLEANAVFNVEIKDAKASDLEVNLTKAAAFEAVKSAVSAKSNVDLVENSGKLVTGSALKYGVTMNPTCLAPSRARFARILPVTAVGRFWNYIKFNLVEPLLPAT
jgi:hypothetical protein